MIARVLEKTGASKRARGMFYKTVAMTVLLYGCESWVITDSMRKVLEGFHHRIARRISGKVAQRVGEEWHYPPIEEALEEAGLWPMREYIRRRQATIADFIATRPIFELCNNAEVLGGASRVMRWWQQDHSAPADGDGVAVVGDADDDEDVDGSGDDE